MPDYQNSKIYKIVDNTNGNIYVGSTTEKYLSKRLQRHLSNYKYWIKNNKIYYSSFEIFKNNNYYIELIENVNCNDIYELRNRERYYIENCECGCKISRGNLLRHKKSKKHLDLVLKNV